MVPNDQLGMPQYRRAKLLPARKGRARLRIRSQTFLFLPFRSLLTDHKPLLGLLSECKSTSAQASAWVCRWSLYLSQFKYRLTFRRTTAHANADALSRLPLPVQLEIQQPPPEVVLLCQHLDDSPITSKQIQEETDKDPLLSTVRHKVGQTLSLLNLIYDHSLNANWNCLCTKDVFCVDLAGSFLKSIVNSLRSDHRKSI